MCPKNKSSQQMKDMIWDHTGQNNRDRCRPSSMKVGLLQGKCFEEQVGMENVFESGQGCHIVADMLLFAVNGQFNSLKKKKKKLKA